MEKYSSQVPTSHKDGRKESICKANEFAGFKYSKG